MMNAILLLISMLNDTKTRLISAMERLDKTPNSAHRMRERLKGEIHATKNEIADLEKLLKDLTNEYEGSLKDEGSADFQ